MSINNQWSLKIVDKDMIGQNEKYAKKHNCLLNERFLDL